MTKSTCRWALVLILFACVSSVATAQETTSISDPLTKAKALYASADYEEALSLLGGVAMADAQAAEAAQYRAFCLVALGRHDDALSAIELVVREDPMFVPAAADFSPRVLTLFNDTRRKVLPSVIMHLYQEGRKAHNAKAHARALGQFEQVVRLSGDPLVKDVAEVADLGVLASGFVDLARAAVTALEKTAAAASAAGSGSASSTPAAPRMVRAPVAIRQDLPQWRMPQGTVIPYDGMLHVRIGADGKVISAGLERPIHPMYDPLLLNAARSWLYTAATGEDGRPMESVKQISIRLFP